MRVLLIGLLTLTLSGCFLRPYHVPIQQGTLLIPKQIKQIEPGMNEAQVRFILGSPDIIDPFHPDTWYYVYTNEVNYLPRSQNNFVVKFKNKQVAQISGDYPPPTQILYRKHLKS